MASNTSPVSVGTSGDVGAGPPKELTRAHATRALFTGKCPQLSALSYVICFNRESKDPNNHASNWRCLQKPQHWEQLTWVKLDASLTIQERTQVVSMESPTLADTFGSHKFSTFARVEFGKFHAYYPRNAHR